MPRCLPIVLSALTLAPLPAIEQRETEVCVYGATPAGILAAVAVARTGHRVILVEPSRWVGGILGAGLKPMQDCPNIHAVGGLSRELLPNLGQPQDGPRVGMAQLAPAAIEQDFRQLLQDHGVPVVYEQRLNRCELDGGRITAAVFDRAAFDDLGCPIGEPVERDSLRVSAKVFIDASYEGDLLPAAGVSYQVGRESEETYQEVGAGVRPPVETAPIDPYVVPGDPASGLLPLVDTQVDLPIGSADEHTQAYNYRIYITNDPAHRLPLTPPDGYEPQQFELVGRYLAYLVATMPDQAKLFGQLRSIFPGASQAGVYNFQRHSLFTMAPVGVSQVYAEGGWSAKAKVWKLHQDYFRGLHHFLSTDPRVPEQFRRETAALGLDGRHHANTGGWPHQLYIRVSRRMIGQYVITANDIYNRTTIEDSIGLAQYGIDTYPSRRVAFVEDGQVKVGLDGWMFVGGARGPTGVPYPIPYRAITPKADECRNLLVPLCFSGSHLGYASARMEPVYMVVGESAGIAAVRAIEEQADVQAIDPAKLQAALLSAGQKLVWQIPTDPLERHAEWVQRLLAEGDQDGNGVISKAEWNKVKAEHAWLFEKIDTDGDGVLTMLEYAAFQDYKLKYPDWQQRLRAPQ